MRLGLIARSDNSGLGNQTWELHRHLNPDKTLVIDLSSIANADDHCNKTAYLERFPGAIVNSGMTPPPDVIEEFLDGIDVLFTAETFYCHDMLHRAIHREVKTILQYNYEFLPHASNSNLVGPTLFAAPSLWKYFTTRLENKVHLPVPIATDRFIPNPNPPDTAKVFLHPVGRPAIHDRNGTEDLIGALPLVRSEITMIFRCQRPGYVQGLLQGRDFPSNINIQVDDSAPPEYWRSYQGIDAVILPRRYGGLCLPANEALGQHIPVLMPNIDPNNRWLPEEWLVPCRQMSEFQAANPIMVHHTPPTTLALYIDTWAMSAEAYSRAVRQAKVLAKAYSWDTLKSQYHDTFAKVMAMEQN
jgi:glycosyltransferase involved in cell wall biosynthesis